MHIKQIKEALGISGVMTNVGSWVHSQTPSHPQGAQIDLLIERADAVVNLCEIKYAYGPYSLSAEECRKLLKRRDVFQSVTGTTHSIHITMITPDGVEESSERHFVQSEVTLNDLFK